MKLLTSGVFVLSLCCLGSFARAEVPVEVTSATVEAKTHGLGKNKGKHWVDLVLTLKIKAKTALLQTVKVKPTCKAGAETLTGDFHVKGAGLDKLAPDTVTEALHARLWFDDGVAVKPEKCTFELAWGKSNKDDEREPIGAWCWDGSAVAVGACTF
jgi:hypothetical protein